MADKTIDFDKYFVTSWADASEIQIQPLRQRFFAAERKSPKTVFVAYPYAFSKNDYRESFSAVGEEFGVSFLYADEQITNKQILVKIKGMIEEATFSIFDITTWNPNVALELGIAIGLEEDYYVLFNPEHDSEQANVPSDLGGIDRLQYTDFASLKGELRRLLEQQFGPAGGQDEAGDGRTETGDSFNEVVDRMREQVPLIVEQTPGIQMGGIATQLGVPIEFAQNISRPLLETGALESTGQRRGTRYFLPGQAPQAEEDPSGEDGPEETPAVEE